jgi:polysaccharide export outer membrane protein
LLKLSSCADAWRSGVLIRYLCRAILTVCALLVCGMPAAAQAPATGGTPIPMVSTAPDGVTAKTADDYVLGVGDKVRITVYGDSSLTSDYPVNANGKISMSLIGEVQAAGLTAGGLHADITRRLANGYLNNPQVAIDVLTFRPYYIMGEVSKPGEYPATAGMTVMNAVATAEGFTYRANQKFAYIKHAGETTEEKVRLTPDLLIRPGDTVRISQRFF